MRNVFWAKKIVAGIVFVFAFIVGLSFAVMALWNNILVPVLHVSVIGFWQALGIFGLAKILFGGFPGGGGWGGRGRHGWKQNMGGMKEKWMNMTPEEREKFKHEWRDRCSRWGRPKTTENSSAAE
jgi:Ca2+/H+ antiporter, TMEM165/GDT1 family